MNALNLLSILLCNVLILQAWDFLKLRGKVDECYCTVADVDTTHGATHDDLSDVVTRDYFRFYKLNLDRKCSFWNDIGVCERSTCGLKTCSKDEVPIGLAGYTNRSSQPTCEQEQELSKISNVISDDSMLTLQNIEQHGYKTMEFCVDEDEDSENAVFYDLLQNPERYTGFSGEDSHKIWRSVYQENCFKPRKDNIFLDLSHKSINYMCKEKRVFFRAISGLHSSISIHLAAKYPLKDFFGTTWGPNLAEFSRRFLPESTSGEGPYWLKNLYFVYLVEMRAITKALPLWKKMDFYTGSYEQDSETKTRVISLVESLLSCPDTFDEAQLFKGPAAEEILDDFLVHFRNISAIMDCVKCDKCRLWGKIQIRGLGTALKILFSASPPQDLVLERGEVVTLFNAFNQLSHSVNHVKAFKSQMETSSLSDTSSTSDAFSTGSSSSDSSSTEKSKNSNLFGRFKGGEL